MLLGALLLAGCSTPGRSKAVAGPAPGTSPGLCTRVVNVGSNLVQLQIAVRKFVPDRGKGAAVWLTGVSHIGDSNYYATLQKHLDAQTLVLYEGVSATAHGSGGATGAPPPDWKEPAEALPSDSRRPGLQASMASSLGLVFQLDAIDYNRPNFRNSDLSIEQLRQILEETPAPPDSASAGQSFDSLLELMQGGSLLDGVLQLFMRFLGASPRLQGMSKLTLIETLGQINGDPARLRGLPPAMKQLLDVLVARRNENVIANLKGELQKMPPRGTIAIFYGTGHMPDLEMRLRRELHYRAADELWLTAFSVDLAQAGIPAGEREFLHSFVKRELEQIAAGR